MPDQQVEHEEEHKDDTQVGESSPMSNGAGQQNEQSLPNCVSWASMTYNGLNTTFPDLRFLDILDV